jgi:outer membrane protein assembly factor BamB
VRLTTDHYPTVLLTAVVAGVFSAVVCALLLADFARRSIALPLERPEFVAARAKLSEHPDDEALRGQIRGLDLEFRREYFRRRQFAYRGGWLLAGGLAITLIALRLATTLRRRLPMPAGSPPREDPEIELTRWARWAVAGLVLLLAATAVGLSFGYRSLLPERLDQVAREADAPPASGADAPRSPTPIPAAAALPSPEEFARSWPRFRGPHGAGVSAYDNVPTSWDVDTGEGIRWQTPVPLPGNSSPVVWQDHVFLTGATAKRREVYCFDADTGKLQWQKEVPGTPQSTGAPPKVSEGTGYASSTPATDGRYLFAIFANGDVAAFDFSGRLVWQVSLGIPKNTYGYATSLTTYGELLIIQYDQGSAKEGQSKLLALRATTGEVAWQVPRQVPNSWSTPIVVEQQGVATIMTCADPWVIAYAAADGKEIWRAKCLRQDVGPSPVYADGRLAVVNEFPCLSVIEAGGQGDVTESHVKWTADAGLSDTCSPLVTGPYLLLLASYGTLTCYDVVEGGDPLWEMDFDDGFQSSPSLAGGRVYLFGEEGNAWVIEPGAEEGKQIAEASLGEPCVTSPAFQEGRIYIRGKQHLFCIGTKK